MSTDKSNSLTQVAEELAGFIPDPSSDPNFAKFIGKFKDFLHELEQSPEEAPKALVWLDQLLDGPVYQEIGKILRKFHDQLNLLRQDLPGTIPQFNEEEISAMGDKLEHIMDMTSKAAHETLDLTEQLSQRLEAQEAKLIKSKIKFEEIIQEKSLSSDHQKAAEDQLVFINEMLETTQANNADADSILLAQGYQDLTGQLIQKLLSLVRSMESDLISLIQNFGQSKNSEPSSLQGPLPEGDDSKNNQQDVDGLLTQFGF